MICGFEINGPPGVLESFPEERSGSNPLFSDAFRQIQHRTFQAFDLFKVPDASEIMNEACWARLSGNRSLFCCRGRSHRS
eukprot:s532_g15.t1